MVQIPVFGQKKVSSPAQKGKQESKQKLNNPLLDFFLFGLEYVRCHHTEEGESALWSTHANISAVWKHTDPPGNNAQSGHSKTT